MILATRTPQSPCTLLEEILADADLDALGREDSQERSQALRTEMAAYGTTLGEVEWRRFQLQFLREHHYLTTAARSLRDEGKRQYIATIESQLSELLKP